MGPVAHYANDESCRSPFKAGLRVLPALATQGPTSSMSQTLVSCSSAASDSAKSGANPNAESVESQEKHPSLSISKHAFNDVLNFPLAECCAPVAFVFECSGLKPGRCSSFFLKRMHWWEHIVMSSVRSALDRVAQAEKT